MAEENKSTEKRGIEQFLNENKKMVSIIGGGLTVVVLAILGYIFLYSKPRNEKSKELWWKASVYMEQDSLDLAINGDPTFTGLLSIAKNYSGTYGGNIANYAVGVSYLNMGEYQLALQFLSKCEFNDIILSSMSKGAMGDAYWELGQTGDAEKEYLKAIESEPDQFTTPLYLHKLGLLNELNGRPSEALKYYTKIKDEWEGSEQYREIDKYIARVANK